VGIGGGKWVGGWDFYTEIILGSRGALQNKYLFSNWVINIKRDPYTDPGKSVRVRVG